MELVKKIVFLVFIYPMLVVFYWISVLFGYKPKVCGRKECESETPDGENCPHVH
jgi:hypothetical protein